MRRLSPVLLLPMLLFACGGADPAPSVPSPPTPTTTSTTTPSITLSDPAPGESTALVFDGTGDVDLLDHATVVGRALGDTEVFESPESTEPMMVIPATTILGTVTVLTTVSAPHDGWVEVMLPIRPNGSVGWVRIDDLSLFVVESEVVVDLSDRRLTLYVAGDEVLTTEVAVGSDQFPTPQGRFFVTDNVTLTNPTSAWGPNALGLSARSETITEFNGGDGIIGIHGTNRPDSIGKAASLGCVRVPNDVIGRLHRLVPIGTPVEIRA